MTTPELTLWIIFALLVIAALGNGLRGSKNRRRRFWERRDGHLRDTALEQAQKHRAEQRHMGDGGV